MTRPVEAVFDEVASYLPQGWIWPRRRDTLIGAILWPLAAALARLEQQAEELMAETDPRTATLCLPDFERVLGPDPCGRDVSSLPVADRQKIAFMRWTARGGQSIPYFIELAAKRGVAITIEEFRLSRAGVLRAGDRLVNHPEQFTWLVTLPLGEWQDFRAGRNTAGHRLYTFTLSDIECDLRRAKPAHTEIAFQYVET